VEKAFWLEIIQNDVSVPRNYIASVLLPELLANLGSIDSDLRESAYTILCQWVEFQGLYSHAELRSIAAQLRVNLRHGLGEQGTDSVFLRAFSLLVLNNVVDYDNAHPFLEKQEILVWLDEALAYYQAERDLRGYVPMKGWAHSVAHGADYLVALARNRYVLQSELERILQVIAWRVTSPVPSVFIDLEDERLCVVVLTALRRNLLPLPFLQTWLQTIVQPAGRRPWWESFADGESNITFTNIRAFLHCLYFQLLLSKKPPAIGATLREEILRALRAIDFGFYQSK
jgi:hypothetical protein